MEKGNIRLFGMIQIFLFKNIIYNKFFCWKTKDTFQAFT